MSSGVDGTAAGLPIASQALEPKWVRDGSSSTKKAYESALAFEQVLVEQLAKSLAQTGGVDAESGQEGTGSSEEEGGSAQAGAGELSSLLPQALTGGVMRAGGLGMAAQMTRELAGLASTASTRATEAAATGAVAAPGTDDASSVETTDAARARSVATAAARSVEDDSARGVASPGGTSAP